ncbi:MAG: hypothetical protein IJ766_04745 [Clostridia bacterium]|nr:hypothetical protein [Clostridia bacterium]
MKKNIVRVLALALLAALLCGLAACTGADGDGIVEVSLVNEENDLYAVVAGEDADPVKFSVIYEEGSPIADMIGGIRIAGADETTEPQTTSTYAPPVVNPVPTP